MFVNDRFKELIKTLSFTPNSLSKELNVTQPTIKKLEKGETLPNAKVLIPLLKRYNVNINWLLGGQGEMFLKAEESSIDKTDSSNSRGATCPDMKLLKDKIALLEQSVRDKEKLISLLEKNQK